MACLGEGVGGHSGDAKGTVQLGLGSVLCHLQEREIVERIVVKWHEEKNGTSIFYGRGRN